jgi:hypothetical protein
VEENHLDKAVARLFYKSYSVGLIPLSNQYITDSQDNLVRLSFNRCQKDIDFMLDAFRHFAKMIDQENLNAE